MMNLLETTSAVALHMGVAFGVTYFMTGSLVAGGLTALIESLCNVVAHRYHARFWQRLRGLFQRRAPEPAKRLAGTALLA